MDRIIYSNLVKWKNSSRRKPLILKGVRQCGKTYILRKFGKENYENVAYFNFEASSDLHNVFENELDPHRILDLLRLKFNIRIDNQTLIIFDEIQFCNKALTSLKYFFENAPEVHIACAGSLLGVMLSKPLSFPVGKVNFLTMYPLSFPEFLMAAGKSNWIQYLENLLPNEAVNESIAAPIMDLYKEYCFVGGMPEAVEKWISDRDPKIIRDIQLEVISSFEMDFAKHAPLKDLQSINHVWNSIPQQLSKENTKFVFGHVIKGARAKDLENSLQWLIDAGLAYKVKMISKPSIPISAYADPSAFKLYLFDVGILSAMAKLNMRSILLEDPAYKEFKGSLTENYVLNELIASTGEVPFYWRSGNKAEVDFVHMFDDRIIPIEVKAGAYSRLQSMERYMELFKPEKAFVISEKNVHLGNITSIPLILTWNMKKYVECLSETIVFDG